MFYVYIMASHRRVLYVGFCRTIEKRVWEHQHNIDPDSFTARYKVHKLVHFERCTNPLAGIARENELKSWNRAKKVALIEAQNPRWKDLSAGWGEPYRPEEWHPEAHSRTRTASEEQTSPPDPSRPKSGRSG